MRWRRQPKQILAFRRAYFIDPWNRFDMFIVVGTNLGLLMLWVTGLSYGSIATIIRTFRIGRVLRLVRGLESMAQLFNTLLLTLPSLGNVGALLFLQFFIYAVMGVQLFALVSTVAATVTAIQQPVDLMSRQATEADTRGSL